MKKRCAVAFIVFATLVASNQGKFFENKKKI